MGSGSSAKSKYGASLSEPSMAKTGSQSEPGMDKAQTTPSASSTKAPKTRTSLSASGARSSFRGQKLRVQVTKEALAPKGSALLLRHIRFTDSFSSAYTLGDEVMPSTNYGTSVLHATRVSDGAAVVVKQRLKAKSFHDGDDTSWRMTTEYLLNLPQNDLICELYEVLEDPEAYYVVMEKVDGLDLFESLGSPDRPDRSQIQQIMKQLLEGVAALHATGYIHRDIKLENVMVSPKVPGRSASAKASSMDDFLESTRPKTVPELTSFSGGKDVFCLQVESPQPLVKLIDFDTVEEYSPKTPSKIVMGTDMYIAQEAYSGHYSPASDIFAIGVIGYKLLTGKFPFADALFKEGDNTVGSRTMQQTQENLRDYQINWARPPFDTDTEALDLCRSMMAPVDVDRPTAETAQRHSWFSKTFEQEVTVLPLSRQYS